MAAGWALELFRGKQTREHGDIKIAIPAASILDLCGRFPGYIFDAEAWPNLGNATPDELAATHQTWLRELATDDYWAARSSSNASAPPSRRGVTPTFPDSPTHIGVYPLGELVGQLGAELPGDPGRVVRRGCHQTDDDLRTVRFGLDHHRSLPVAAVSAASTVPGRACSSGLPGDADTVNRGKVCSFSAYLAEGPLRSSKDESRLGGDPRGTTAQIRRARVAVHRDVRRVRSDTEAAMSNWQLDKQ